MMDAITKRARRDDGFTLIELVVTVAILGLISAALLGAVIAYLKVSRTTASRLAESTDQQFVSAYWQADVSSLGNRSLNAAADPPVPASTSVFKNPSGGCGSSTGSVLVRFEWTKFTVGTDDTTAWNTTAESVSYVLVGSSAPYLLERVRCEGGVEGTPIPLSRMLIETPQVQCDGSDTCPTGNSLPEEVTMQLHVRDSGNGASAGYTTTLTADRRQG